MKSTERKYCVCGWNDRYVWFREMEQIIFSEFILYPKRDHFDFWFLMKNHDFLMKTLEKELRGIFSTYNEYRNYDVVVRSLSVFDI